MTQENPTGTPPPLGISQRQGGTENPRIEPSYRGASSLGAMLRDARQKRGLSTADLAGSLNLDLVIVEAIENDRLDEAPEPIYVRAYLKHWAGMMNTDPAPWLAALDTEASSLPSTPRVSARTPVESVRPSRGTGNHRRSGVAGTLWRLLVVIILLGAAVALFALALPSFWQKVTQWLPSHESESPSNGALSLPVTPIPLPARPAAESTEPAAKLPPPPSLSSEATPAAPVANADGMAGAQTNPETVTAPAPSDAAPATEPVPAEPVTEPVSSAPAPAASPSATGAPSPTASSTTEHNALKIAVTAADCWVEVRDATGKRLIYDVLKKGSERSITGKAPFTVVLGHANGVEVTWQDKPVTLPAPNSTTGIIRATVGGS